MSEEKLVDAPCTPYICGEKGGWAGVHLKVMRIEPARVETGCSAMQHDARAHPGHPDMQVLTGRRGWNFSDMEMQFGKAVPGAR